MATFVDDESEDNGQAYEEVDRALEQLRHFILGTVDPVQTAQRILFESLPLISGVSISADKIRYGLPLLSEQLIDVTEKMQTLQSLIFDTLDEFPITLANPSNNPETSAQPSTEVMFGLTGVERTIQEISSEILSSDRPERLADFLLTSLRALLSPLPDDLYPDGDISSEQYDREKEMLKRQLIQRLSDEIILQRLSLEDILWLLRFVQSHHSPGSLEWLDWIEPLMASFQEASLLYQLSSEDRLEHTKFRDMWKKHYRKAIYIR